MSEDRASSDEVPGEHVFDCIIIGAGPGGLQSAIYLGRFNREVLLIDRGGGRTAHAHSIENFLTQRSISGREIIARGMEQAKRFNVQLEKNLVTAVEKSEHFIVSTSDNIFKAKFVVVASGVYDNLPPVENLNQHLGKSFFTCVDCDGFRTTDKKLVVMGNSIETVRLAFAMKQMYTRDITLVLYFYNPPPDYLEELAQEGIRLVQGEPVRIEGNDGIEALEMKDGARIPCEAIMSNFGFKLNNGFLAGLPLARDARGFKYVVNSVYESSVRGLYIVGPLNTGNDQAVIAAGEGAVAAIDINKRLLEL
jgi:thioredoxin reductase (NADPH)